MVEHSLEFAPWLEISAAALTSFTPAVPWGQVSDVLRDRLHAPLAGTFLWSSAGEAQVAGYPDPQTFNLTRVASRAPGRHPLANHYAVTSDRLPHATHQFALDDPAHEYLEELAHYGIDQHLWIPLPTSRGWQTVAGTCRPSDHYTKGELEHARIVQPLLVGLVRHAETVARCPGTAILASDEHHLTAREVAVLELCADGRTTASAGRHLGIAPRTAHKHLENAYRKLHVRDRVSAVLRAHAAGIITLPQGPEISTRQP